MQGDTHFIAARGFGVCTMVLLIWSAPSGAICGLYVPASIHTSILGSLQDAKGAPPTYYPCSIMVVAAQQHLVQSTVCETVQLLCWPSVCFSSNVAMIALLKLVTMGAQTASDHVMTVYTSQFNVSACCGCIAKVMV